MKFVIADRADYEYAREIVLARHDLDRRCAAVLFSPVHGALDAKDLRPGCWPTAAGTRAAAAPQAHLGCGDAGGLTREGRHEHPGLMPLSPRPSSS